MGCTDRIAQYSGAGTPDQLQRRADTIYAAGRSPITLMMDRATADDLLVRLLDTPLREHDSHECYLIVALADALGERVADWMRHRASVFAEPEHVPVDPPTYLPR